MSTRFPSSQYPDAGGYAQDYFAHLARAAATVNPGEIARAGAMLAQCVAAGGQIISCGNGGSAAIANHLVCDCLKGVRANSTIRPRITSLSSNVELLTAIMNDIGPEEVFAYSLESLGRSGDVLITISSSGNSQNIVRALEAARNLGLATIAMTGFDGGRSASMADVNLHVAAENYGLVEDIHQSLMHILAQYLRTAHIAASCEIKTLTF